MPYHKGMAIYDYIGWATNVNRIILDSTTITIGENAVLNTEIENGYKTSRLRGGYVPDKYSVTMEFDWTEIGTDGKTEYQRFVDWYKYKHKFGTIPFEFPAILYSAHTGIKIYDDMGHNKSVEYYKIVSAAECGKSGTMIQVKMTWQTVYAGVVTISTPLPSIRDISATHEYVEVHFSEISNDAPISSQFLLYTRENESDEFSHINISGFYYDGGYIARLYYDLIPTEHAQFTMSYNGNGLVVNKGDYVTIVTL